MGAAVLRLHRHRYCRRGRCYTVAVARPVARPGDATTVTQRRRRNDGDAAAAVILRLAFWDGRIDPLRLVLLLLLLLLLLDDDGTTLGTVANDGRFEIWAVI